jgi:glucose dehydrogenase
MVSQGTWLVLMDGANHYPVAQIVLLLKSGLEIYLPNPSYTYTHTHLALHSNLLAILDSTQLP